MSVVVPSASEQGARVSLVRRRRAGVATLALVYVGIVGSLVATFAYRGRSAIAHFGLGFLWGRSWDPITAHLGTLPFIVGSLETTAIAMTIAVPVGLGCALFVVCFASPRIGGVVSVGIELLAGVPSVVYGLWGLQILAPLVRSYLEPALHGALGGSRIVSGPELGIGLLLAGIVLSVMALPTMVSVTRDALSSVPSSQLEAALALGATRWQGAVRVVLPAARSGVFGAVALALGRAVGETIAVAMVIGDTPKIASSLFGPADTLTSVLANEFSEAGGSFHEAALFELALLLLAVSVAVNVVARALARSIGRRRVQVSAP